jgi:hypothetical protein
MLFADNHLGDGSIDNIVIDASVHVVVGSLVLLSMLAATLWVGRLALARRAIDRTGQILLAVAQAVLLVQVLIGIKLLDQGQGIVQLYIHYVGGALPLGLYLIAGWFAWNDPVKRTRAIALLTTFGMVSVTMAFFIGREFANRSL